MPKNKFEIKPLKPKEEQKQELTGLPFLTGESPLPNKTKTKNAIDLFLDNKWLDIQYNKRRNEVIEKSDNPTEKLQEIKKLESTGKGESQDIQSKLKEQWLNNDFEPQYIMRSGEPDVQKKRVYRGPQVGFTDEEVEVPRSQEISDEQVDVMAEIEKIRPEFEKIYREKIKYAKPVSKPDREVIDPMSGTPYTIPGDQKSAEDIAKDETLDQLVSEGTLSSKGYNLFEELFKSAVPIGATDTRREAELSFQASPIERFMYGGVGMLLGYGGTSTILKAPQTFAKVTRGVEKTLAGAKKIDKGFKIGTMDPVKARQVADVSGRAISSAQTFGSYSALDMIGEDLPVSEKVENILGSAFLGVGLGAAGSVSSPFKRIPAEGLVGFTTGILETGDPKEATINALMFMGFGLINRKNIKPNEQRILYERVAKDVLTYFKPQIKGLQTRAERDEARKFIIDSLKKYRNSNPTTEQLRKDIQDVRKNILYGLQKLSARRATGEAIRKQTAQEATRAREPQVKKLKESVEVPVEGEIPSISRDNLVKMSLNDQRKNLQKLGYSETQVINLGKEDRLNILANSIKPVNFYEEGQPELEEIKPVQLEGKEPEVEEIKPKVPVKVTRDKMREELFGEDGTKEPVVEKVEPEIRKPVKEKKPKLKTKKKKKLETKKDVEPKDIKVKKIKPTGKYFADDLMKLDKSKFNRDKDELFDIYKGTSIKDEYGYGDIEDTDGNAQILYKLFDADFHKATKGLESGKDYPQYLKHYGSSYIVTFNNVYTGYHPNGKKATDERIKKYKEELDAIEKHLKDIGLEKWAKIWAREITEAPKWTDEAAQKILKREVKFWVNFDKKLLEKYENIDQMKTAEINKIYGEELGTGASGMIDYKGGVNPEIMFYPKGNPPFIIKGKPLADRIKEIVKEELGSVKNALKTIKKEKAKDDKKLKTKKKPRLITISKPTPTPIGKETVEIMKESGIVPKDAPDELILNIGDKNRKIVPGDFNALAELSVGKKIPIEEKVLKRGSPLNKIVSHIMKNAKTIGEAEKLAVKVQGDNIKYGTVKEFDESIDANKIIESLKPKTKPESKAPVPVSKYPKDAKIMLNPTAEKIMYWIVDGRGNPLGNKGFSNNIDATKELLGEGYNKDLSTKEHNKLLDNVKVKKLPVDAPKKLDVVDINPKDIKMDESKFQPREQYNQSIIDDIAKNYDPAKWEEPVLWKDDTGDMYVVSGHHRIKGAVEGGISEVPVKVLPEGTTLEQARDYAGESNVTRTQQSDFENASEVRRRLDRGDKALDIANIMPGMFPKAKTDASKKSAISNLANLSYLDSNGKLKQNYESTNEFPRIVSISKFVGGLRKKHDFLTDRHEDDIFTHLYTENAIKGDVDDFYRKIDNIIERMESLDDKPASILKELRKEPQKVNEDAATEIKDKAKELEKHIDNLKRQLDDRRIMDDLTTDRIVAIDKKKYANEEKTAREYDKKWQKESNWFKNLYRLTSKELYYTQRGEASMTSQPGAISLSDMDQKHLESIKQAVKDGKNFRSDVHNEFQQKAEIPFELVKSEAFEERPYIEYYQETVAIVKEQIKQARQELKIIIESSNKDDENQTSIFESMKQYNIFGGVDRVKTLDTRQKAELESIYDELIQINKELEQLSNQKKNKKINTLSYNKQYKELQQRKVQAEKQKDAIIKDTPQDKVEQYNLFDSMTKYHGSPHNFKSFSTKSIDSGEGSQMEGWGLYFSDKKDIAQWYANRLGDHTTESFKIGDLSLITLNENDQAIFNYDPYLMEKEWYKHSPMIRHHNKYKDSLIYAEIIENLFLNEYRFRNAYLGTFDNLLHTKEDATIKGVILDHLREYKKYADDELATVPTDYEEQEKNKIRIYDELIKLVKNDNFEYKLEKNKNLYTVDIASKSPNEFRWMDWHEPIDITLRDELYQLLKDIKSGKIKAPEYLDKKEIDLKEWEDVLGISEDYLDEIGEGRQVYDLLTYLMKEDIDGTMPLKPKATSMFLRDYLKLDGNRYKAMGASGGKTGDVHNYVVFDDKAISIKDHSMFEPSERFPNFTDIKKPFRENATPEQKDLTIQLRKELSEPNPRGAEDSGAWSGLGSGYTIRGNAITKPLREKGFIDLVGTKVKTSHDLAMAAQVLRDPRYETLRIFYIKDNKVVFQNAVTNRLPGGVMGLDDVSGKDLSAVIREGMSNTKADGYYMMHNHPTGSPEPSKADLKYTSIQDKEVKGFLGHIIIDSGSYATITKSPEAKGLRVKQIEFDAYPDDKLLTPSIEHKWLGKEIYNTADLAPVARGLEQNGFFTLIGLDGYNRIRGVVDVPYEFFNDKVHKMQKTLKEISANIGSMKMISIVDADSGISPWHLTTLNKLNVSDSLTDIIVKQNGKLNSYADHSPRALTFGEKGSTLVAEKKKIDNPRRKALARAHILENEIGLTDDERRTYKKVITGYDSLGEASDTEIASYIDWLLKRKYGSKPIRQISAPKKKTLKELAAERKQEIDEDRETIMQRASKVLKKPIDGLGLYWVYNRQSMQRTLEKMGDGGNALLKMFKEADYYHSSKVKPSEVQMEKLWKKVPSDEKEIMKKIIESNGASDLSEGGQAFLRFWKDTTNDIYAEGKKYINEELNFIENYFPLSLKPEIYNDMSPQHPRWDEIVDHVQRVISGRVSQGDVFSGYSVSKEETEKYIIDFLDNYRKQGLRQHFIQQVFEPTGKFKHSYPLELHRDRIFPEWAYVNDVMDIAHAYIDKSYEAIGYAKEFGKMDEEYKYENIDKELEVISADGYDHKLAANIMGWSMGLKRQDIYDETFNRVARSTTTFLLTPRTTLKNLTDLGKAFSQSGTLNTLYSIARLYIARNKKDRQLAHDLIGSKYVFAQSLEKTGIGAKMASFYADNVILFTRSERSVRETIGFSRVLQAEQLLKNYDPSATGMMQDHIKRLFNVVTDGLDIDKIKRRGYFTRDEKLRIGNNAIGQTQPTSTIDKPYNWASKGFWTRKSIFQSFSHRSIRWLKDFILEETKRGNMFPMVNLILWRLALGYGYKEASDWLWNKEPEEEETKMKKAWGIMLETGEIGIIGDLLFAVQHSGWANPFISILFGPKYSLMFETLMNFGQTVNRAINDKENPLRPIKRQAARMTIKRIPLVGQKMYDENFGRKKKKLKTKKAPTKRSKGRQAVYN